MCDRVVDRDAVTRRLVALRDAIHVPEKDIIFAWGMVAPFRQ
jgi:hypothetical protein